MIYFSRGLYSDYNGYITRGLYIGEANADTQFALPFLKITSNLGLSGTERQWVGSDDNKMHILFGYRVSESRDINKIGCSYFKLFSVQKGL